MNQKQIQARAFEYIANRVAGVQADVAASGDNGISNDEVETFMGWFSTFEDFRDWVINESNWDRETCVHASQIHDFIIKVLHC
jgi:hypothetical protein